MTEINVPYQFPNVLSGIIVSDVASLLPNAVLHSGKTLEKLTIDYQFDFDGRYWTIGLEFVHDEFNYHASDNDIVELFLEINRDQVCLCLSKGGDRDKVVISSKLKKVESREILRIIKENNQSIQQHQEQQKQLNDNNRLKLHVNCI